MPGTTGKKDVAFTAPHSPGSGLPAVALWFSTLTVRCRVRAVPCIHCSRAAVDTTVRWRRCGHPVLPSRQPCSSGRSSAQISRPHPPVPVFGCVRLRLSWRLCIPGFNTRLLWMHGTARCRRPCDYGGFYAVFKSATSATCACH